MLWNSFFTHFYATFAIQNSIFETNCAWKFDFCNFLRNFSQFLNQIYLDERKHGFARMPLPFNKPKIRVFVCRMGTPNEFFIRRSERTTREKKNNEKITYCVNPSLWLFHIILKHFFLFSLCVNYTSKRCGGVTQRVANIICLIKWFSSHIIIISFCNWIFFRFLRHI